MRLVAADGSDPILVDADPHAACGDADPAERAMFLDHASLAFSAQVSSGTSRHVTGEGFQ
jgi:hypothetical protein